MIKILRLVFDSTVTLILSKEKEEEEEEEEERERERERSVRHTQQCSRQLYQKQKLQYSPGSKCCQAKYI